MNDSVSASPDGASGRSERQGPPPILALAAFAGLVLGAMCVVVVLVTLARLVQAAV